MHIVFQNLSYLNLKQFKCMWCELFLNNKSHPAANYKYFIGNFNLSAASLYNTATNSIRPNLNLRD